MRVVHADEVDRQALHREPGRPVVQVGPAELVEEVVERGGVEALAASASTPTAPRSSGTGSSRPAPSSRSTRAPARRARPGTARARPSGRAGRSDARGCPRCPRRGPARAPPSSRTNRCLWRCQGAMCRSERCSTVRSGEPAGSSGRVARRIVKSSRSTSTPQAAVAAPRREHRAERAVRHWHCVLVPETTSLTSAVRAAGCRPVGLLRHHRAVARALVVAAPAALSPVA